MVFVGPFEHHSNLLPWRELASEVGCPRPCRHFPVSAAGLGHISQSTACCWTGSQSVNSCFCCWTGSQSVSQQLFLLQDWIMPVSQELFLLLDWITVSQQLFLQSVSQSAAVSVTGLDHNQSVPSVFPYHFYQYN